MDDPLLLIAAIGRVRRAQPRNVDAMSICDGLEALLQMRPASPAASEKFDKVAYMREYMRRRRVKQK